MSNTQPSNHSKTLSLVFCALFTALIAAGAFLKIPIPNMPITMQLFFVIMSGLLLGAKAGAASALVYMILGLAGIPIFTAGGGIGYIFKPTFGYIIGFIFGAFVTGLIANKEKNPSYKRLLAASFAGLAVVYTIGIIYFYLIRNVYMSEPISAGNVFLYCFVFVAPGDIVLNFLAAFLAKKLKPILNNRLTAK